MSSPVTAVNLATGASQNVAVVDQGGNVLPDSAITWSSGDVVFNAGANPANQLNITNDLVNGGFVFAAVKATTGTGTLTATHGPSGKTAVLSVTITNSVTGISFVSLP